MNHLYVTHNLGSDIWITDFTQLNPMTNILYISFTSGSNIVEFKSLRFGYELKKNENIVSYKYFPTPGKTYRKTDQKYLESVTFDFTPNTSYTLFLWVETNNHRSEKEILLDIPNR